LATPVKAESSGFATSCSVFLVINTLSRLLHLIDFPDQLSNQATFLYRKSTRMIEAGPIIYLIRHGEKGAKLPNGKDPDGLDAQGLSRAEGLPKVFGSSSGYNVSYILAEHPKSGRSIVMAHAGIS
jgi:hypothetical protein